MPYNLAPSSRRRKARGRIALLFALIVLALTVLPTASFAGTDTAGNVLATDEGSTPSGVEGDLYWAGQSLNLDDASIGRDIIAAGREPVDSRLHRRRRRSPGGAHHRYRQNRNRWQRDGSRPARRP